MATSARAPTVGVVIVAYNAGEHLARCLAALALQTYTDFEVVVVDNASTDGAIEALGALAANVRVVRLGRNAGFAGGCNAGARETAAPWLAMLNPDAFPEPDWLERMVAAAGRHPGADVLAAVLVDARDPGIYDGLGDCYSPYGIGWRGADGHRMRAERDDDVSVLTACAAAAFYRADAFREIGGFDERYFCYFEDVDLGLRMRLRGGECVLVHDAVVHHVGSGTTGRNSPFTVYHGFRNRIWTFWKDMPPLLMWTFAPAFAVAHAPLLLKAALHGRLGAALRGVRDGLAGLPALAEARSAVRISRRVPLVAFARRLTWSPLALARRSPDLRRLAD